MMRKLIMGFGAIAAVAVAVPAVAQPINQREHRQEQRIRQGERSGQLTPAEARRLQYLEARLHRTEARMRWRSGGRLTPRERQRLQAMADRDSAAIKRLKHNYRSF
jgi:DNA-binding CsgD family transcriptional regulator